MRPSLAALGVVPILVVVAACGGEGSPEPSASPSKFPEASTASAAPSSQPSSATSRPECPNLHGGLCLGTLEAGTYTTVVFATPLTYTVPDGWSNQEDLPGNFILLPPTATVEEIDAGTADYVGVYDGIAVASADCAELPQDLDRDPDAMAAWFVAHEGLEPTEPVAVTVGGLEGVVVDLRIADGYTEGCPYEGYEGVPMVPLLIGAGPAEIHHVAFGETVTRLYLLAGEDGRVLAIEVSDTAGGAELEELDAIVDDFAFSPGG